MTVTRCWGTTCTSPWRKRAAPTPPARTTIICTSVKMNYQCIQRQPFTSLRVGGGITKRDKCMGDEPRIELERLADDFRAEERSTHPAGVEAQVKGHEQHILYGSAEALNSHCCLISLAFLVGIAVQVFQIETGNDNGGSIQDALP